MPTLFRVRQQYRFNFRYIDDRIIRVEDDSLLEGWAKLLVARKDLSKYDLYIQR